MNDMKYFVSRILLLVMAMLGFFFVDFTILSVIGRCLACAGAVSASAYFAFFMTVCWMAVLFWRGEFYGF